MAVGGKADAGGQGHDVGQGVLEVGIPSSGFSAQAAVSVIPALLICSC
jgi:hypothetical protein